MAKTKLKDLEVTEVSLVDAGANQHAHVALYKRNGGKPEEKPTGQNPEQTPAKSGLHKFFSAIGKALKLDQADIDSAVADIEKQIHSMTRWKNANSAALLMKFGTCVLHWKTACAALSGTKK